MNLQHIIKKQRKTNQAFFAVIILLVIILISLTWKLFFSYQQKKNLLNASYIEIQNTTDLIKLEKANNHWKITTPFQSNAQNGIAEAILGHLTNNCRISNQVIDKQTISQKKLTIDNQSFFILEANPKTQELYIAQKDSVYACPALLNTMLGMSPINFLSRTLFTGDLIRIKSNFGVLDQDQVKSIDFTILNIAFVKKDIDSLVLGTLSFYSQDNEKQQVISYDVIYDDSNQQFILIEPNYQFAYVISADKAIKKILGI